MPGLGLGPAVDELAGLALRVRHVTKLQLNGSIVLALRTHAVWPANSSTKSIAVLMGFCDSWTDVNVY